MSAYTGQVQVDFAHDPTSASFTWVDITNRARAANYRRGRNYELAQVEAGGGTAKLRNDDGALDPTNGASTYSPNVIPFRRFQHNITVTGPGTVPIFTGLVERWPQEWDTGYGYAPVQVVDIFAWLSLAQLRSCYEQEILTDAPLCFYPLTEPAGSTSATDISGNAAPALITATLDHGDTSWATAAGIPTDTSTTLALNTTLTTGASDDLAGSYLQSNGTIAVPGGGNFTVEALVTVNATLITALARTVDSTLVVGLHIPTGDFNALPAITLASSSGAVKLYDPMSLAVVAGCPDLNDGKPHHIALVNNHAGSLTTFYVDGVSVGTNAIPINYFGGLQVVVGGVNQQDAHINNPYVPHRGGLGYVAVYPTALSGTRVAAHNAAARTAFAGETADARIARILGYVGWTATTALDACTTTMLAASDLTGKSALAAIQEVQASEGGVFFSSKAGVLTYKSRRTRMQTTTSSATFGENTAGGEVPCLNVAFDFDPTYVYNDVQVTRPGAPNVSASSSTSRAHYGQRTLPLTLSTQSDVEAQDAANWLLNASLAPHLRVRSISVDCLATPGAWAAILPLEIGSRVTVKKRPANGTTITANSFVEAISWDIVDGKRAICTFEVSPIPLQALIADDATYGICDSTFVAAW